MNVIRLAAVLIFIAAGWSQLPAQTSSTTIAGDEVANLLTKARSSSELEADSTPAFHLTATFETFDYMGHPDGDGTIEEFWDGTSRMRRAITYRGTSQVRVLDHDEFVSSEPFESSVGLRSLLQGLFKALTVNPNQPNLLTEGRKVKIGGVDTDCIAVAFKSSSAIHAGASGMPQIHDTYCLSSDRHVLRLANTSNGLTYIYNNLEVFGPRAIAHELTIKNADVVRGRLHIKSLVNWTPDDAMFIPPLRSASYARTAASGVPGRVFAGSRISGDGPQYPLSAKTLRISGVVVLSAVISRAGAVEGIDIISSPNPDFAKAAVEAVKTWKYSPYLVNNHPVEVDTVIHVNFGF